MAETDGTLTALDVLRRDGWHQGGYAEDDDRRSGAACLLGARARALTGDACCWTEDDLEWEATTAAVIAEQFPDRTPTRRFLDPVVFFNDHPDTTFADVELVLEKAQLRLDEDAADA